MKITGLDFIGVPSTDADRAREFYRDVLELRPDSTAEYEFWAGETCLAIWEPTKFGMEFEPQHNGHIALHVEDVDAARAELEGKGVQFLGETIDSGVCKMALFRDPDDNDLMLHGRYAD